MTEEKKNPDELEGAKVYRAGISTSKLRWETNKVWIRQAKQKDGVNMDFYLAASGGTTQVRLKLTPEAMTRVIYEITSFLTNKIQTPDVRPPTEKEIQAYIKEKLAA